MIREEILMRINHNKTEEKIKTLTKGRENFFRETSVPQLPFESAA